MRGADRMTVAVTLFALLELYKRGEADWEQGESFGEIDVRRARPTPVGGLSLAGGAVQRPARAWPAPDSVPPRGAGRVSEPHADAPRLARTIEALLFLSTDPLSVGELADAMRGRRGRDRGGARAAGRSARAGPLGHRAARARRRLDVRQRPRPRRMPRAACSAARALATLTPAQAETLAIVAYLQPVSRPEIARIRGVSADSAVATLLDRGLIEEAGHSQFGAIVYRTTTQFLKLFGLRSLEELPDVARWDPTPEEQAELRERLLRAGEARAS